MLIHFFRASAGAAPLWLFFAAAGVILLALALVVWSAMQPDLEESFEAAPGISSDDDRPISA